MREVIENFEDPSKYLSLDPRIVVGLLPFKSKKKPLPNNLTHQENITSNLISDKENEKNSELNEIIEGLIGVGVKHFEEIEKENKKMI